MAPASTVAGLRAENALLREQLNAERCASQQKVEQLLIKNGAALSALKDEVRSIRKSEPRNPRESQAAPVAQRKRQHVSSSSSGSSSTDTTAPLDKDYILDNVFGYVGGGDHLYIAGVNRRWRGR
jgi:septal ring factor EnvC (AmiA/AmiB activator)